MKLSDKACRAAQPHDSGKRTPKKLSDGGGLQLWVMPNGSKYWRYKYRTDGKEKTLALGVYPEVSLKEARQAHTDARKKVLAGLDPSALKQEKLSQKRNSTLNTFEAVAREWIKKRRCEVRAQTVNNIEYRLEKDVFPVIGKIPVNEITPMILLDMLRKVEQRGALEMTSRARQYCSQIMRYAIATGRAERDFTKDIGDALKVRTVQHQPAMSFDELPEFMGALNHPQTRLLKQTKLALNMLLLTFVRPVELASAEWEDFDFKNDRWIIPAAKMKLGLDHVVPLSTQVLNIIEQLKPINGKGKYLFTNQIHPKKHMSRDALSKAVRNLGFQGRHTPHGFRALARTAIRERLGYDSEVIERQLAHVPGTSLGRTYDRTQFIEKRTEMMQAWADLIDRHCYKSI